MSDARVGPHSGLTRNAVKRAPCFASASRTGVSTVVVQGGKEPEFEISTLTSPLAALPLPQTASWICCGVYDTTGRPALPAWMLVASQQ